jgi:hypothetical protein
MMTLFMDTFIGYWDPKEIYSAAAKAAPSSSSLLVIVFFVLLEKIPG